MKNLKKFIKDWDGKQNLVFVTHYVVISEILNYAHHLVKLLSQIKILKLLIHLK